MVCSEVAAVAFDGASVRYVRLAYNAATDNYNEVELDFVLDIASPTSPNWTCTDSRVKCTSNTRNHYAMVSAVPYRDGSRVQLYVNAWGMEVPTLPQIGEADEDQSFDAERGHIQESIVYWVFGRGSGAIRAQPISPVDDQTF